MTQTRRTVLPAIPPVNVPGDLGVAIAALQEIAEVLTQRRGDPLDAAVTFRDLRDGGIADVRIAPGGGLRGSGGRRPGGNGGGIFLDPVQPGTLPVPNGHLNVRTRSIWDGIQILWDWPPGNIEYAYTEIWAAKHLNPNDPDTVPAFSQAVLVGSSAGNLFSHLNLGLGSVWYYWLRYVGFVPPDNPSAGAPMSPFTPGEVGRGVKGQTAVDPTYVLGVLSGQIGNDQLALGLSNRIDLVDYYYNERGQKVPVPQVDVVDENGAIIPNLRVSNVRNQVLLALRDSNSAFQAAIAQEAAIRVSDGNTLAASYGIKIDIGGFITGFGLLATRVNQTDPETGLTTVTDSSSFVIRANRFAVVFPDQPNAPPNAAPVIPFVVGTVNGVNTVGINGALVVDGTITARMIQAGQIGAREINAAEVWAGIVNADRVFASRFATSGDLNWRVEIGGQNATYPFWYGQGETGGANSVFFLDRNGNVSLAGNLTVSGQGRFRTGTTGGRVELGGDDGNALWIGAGERTNANAKMRVTTNGDIYTRGLPLTIPVASGGNNTTITVVPRDGSNTAPVLAMASGVVIEGGGEDDDKSYTVKLWVGNVVAAEYAVESMDEEFLPVSIMGVANVTAGSHAIRVELADVDYTGGGSGLQLDRVTVCGFQAAIVEGSG